jgi:transposase
MHKEAREELRIRLKLVVLEYAKHVGVVKACREFNVPRSTFYRWKKKHDKEGRFGLYRKKPVAYSHPRKTSPEVVEKILELRKGYHLGALRITYYLDRYHGDSDFGIHGDQSIASPQGKSAAKDSSPTCSSYQTVCKKGSRTPRSVRCEVLAVER